MIRRPILRARTSEQLRDYLVELAGTDEVLVHAILRHWRPDAKRDKRVARHHEAHAIEQLLRDGGNAESVRGRHNSVAALDKWRRRNRRLPEL
jgi:hypothetical protein